VARFLVHGGHLPAASVEDPDQVGVGLVVGDGQTVTVGTPVQGARVLAGAGKGERRLPGLDVEDRAGSVHANPATRRPSPLTSSVVRSVALTPTGATPRGWVGALEPAREGWVWC
jgi:hypothetical protein